MIAVRTKYKRKYIKAEALYTILLSLYIYIHQEKYLTHCHIYIKTHNINKYTKILKTRVRLVINQVPIRE